LVVAVDWGFVVAYTWFVLAHRRSAVAHRSSATDSRVVRQVGRRATYTRWVVAGLRRRDAVTDPVARLAAVDDAAATRTRAVTGDGIWRAAAATGRIAT
jgi:hypothetical protein